MTMSWSKYAEFLAFAAVLIVVPGPDFAVVTKNTLVGGRRRGRWTALGVSNSNLVQGTAAPFGPPGRVRAAGRQRPRQHGAERGRVAAGLHLQHHQPESAGVLPRRAAAVPGPGRGPGLAAPAGLEPRGPEPGLPARAGHR